jgi:hypothetical protein
MDNKNFIPPLFYFELGGHLGWNSGSTDTILERGYPRIISAKFGRGDEILIVHCCFSVSQNELKF